MSSFFDICFDKNISISEFIDGMDCCDEKSILDGSLCNIVSFLKFIASNNNKNTPEIVINTSDRVYAEGMEGRIVVSHGLLRFCLDRASVPYDEIIGLHFDIPYEIKYLPMITWAVAHEFWHEIRRHSLLSESIELTKEQWISLEIDADLCAIASLYRFMQERLKYYIDDISIRKMVMISVFWVLRSLAMSIQEVDCKHPKIFERIYHINSKLAHIRSNCFDPADPDLITNESRYNASALAETLLKAEKVFCEKHQINNSQFVCYLMEFIINADFKVFTSNWEALKGSIQNVSGTRT